MIKLKVYKLLKFNKEEKKLVLKKIADYNEEQKNPYYKIELENLKNNFTNQIEKERIKLAENELLDLYFALDNHYDHSFEYRINPTEEQKKLHFQIGRVRKRVNKALEEITKTNEKIENKNQNEELGINKNWIKFCQKAIKSFE